MSRLASTVLCLLFIWGIAGNGAPPRVGTVDASFDPGFGIRRARETLQAVRLLIPFGDDAIIAAGSFTNYAGVPRNGLVRILDDGSIDKRFDPNSALSQTFEVMAVAEQSEGKLLVGGLFEGRLVRLNSDGSMDSSFRYARSASDFFVSLLSVRPNGQIIVGSDQGLRIIDSTGQTNLFTVNALSPFGPGHSRFSPFGGAYLTPQTRIGGALGDADDVYAPYLGNDFAFQSDGRIVYVTGSSIKRIGTDLALDTSFQTTGSGNVLAAQSDDKLIVGGSFRSINGTQRNYIARLLPDGSLDTNFAGAPGPNGAVEALALLPNGKAVIAGSFTTVDGLSRTGIARIFLDPPAPPVFLRHPISTNLVEGGDLKLFASVSGTAPFSFQWRRGNDSIPDATNSWLRLHGVHLTDAGDYSVEARNGLGSAQSESASIEITPTARTAGSVDVEFARGEGANRSIFGQVGLPDGRKLVIGDFRAFDGEPRPGLARLHADGTLDRTFVPILRDVFPLCAASLSDGKILVGGNAMFAYGPVALSRLNSDGSVDSNFLAKIAVASVNDIHVQSDQKIVVGGTFYTVGSTKRERLARLNADGSLDEGFNPNVSGLRPVYALVGLDDGRIVVGAENRVLKLSAEGSVEADVPIVFFPTNGTGGLRALALQKNGKILVGGHFTTVGGVPSSGLARLNPDMTADSDFDPSIAGVPEGGPYIDGAYMFVRAIMVQPDHRIVVGGTFTNLAGVTVPGLGRLFEDGTFDDTFRPTLALLRPSFGTAALSLSLDDDGGVIIGGKFTRVNDVTRKGLARIYAFDPFKVSAALRRDPTGAIDGVVIKFSPEPSFDYELQYRETLQPDGAWLPVAGAPHNSGQVTDSLSGPSRLYRVEKKPRP